MLSQQIRSYNNININISQTILKIELPKKKELISKKPKTSNVTNCPSDYAYGFDQIISSSPNTIFFINSLKTRLNKY